jgi:hypothetical protein
MCSSILFGRSVIPLADKSLSTTNIFAQDWLLFAPMSSGIRQDWSSHIAIIKWRFNFQHTQDKLTLMILERDIEHLRMILQRVMKPYYYTMHG